jgi:putative glutamine amidotransferase
VTKPKVLVAPHRRALDSLLGRHDGCVVPEGYLRLLHGAGALSLTTWMGEEDVDTLLEVADGVLLIGGGDIARESFAAAGETDAVDPERDDFESALVNGARERRLPLLGMCRGAQQLNVTLGGSLRRVHDHRQQEDLAQPTQAVSITSGSRMGGVFTMGEVKVNSFHRWAVDRTGKGLTAVATSADGVVEGIESTTEWWALGVQWHAELLDDPQSHSLFDGFVAVMRHS